MTNEDNAHTAAMKLQLGDVRATRGVLNLFDGDMDAMLRGISGYVMAHSQGDFGKVDPEDVLSNMEAWRTGERVLSAYELLGGTRIWVITDAADATGVRSSTTVLLPSEY